MAVCLATEQPQPGLAAQRGVFSLRIKDGAARYCPTFVRDTMPCCHDDLMLSRAPPTSLRSMCSVSCIHVPVQPQLGLAAEHGYYLRYSASQEWSMHSSSHNDFTWKEMVLPILEVSPFSASQASKAVATTVIQSIPDVLWLWYVRPWPLLHAWSRCCNPHKLRLPCLF